MDIYDKINEGHYQVSGEYPVKPVDKLKHKLLRDMTDEEIAAYPNRRKEYEAAKKIYREKCKQWQEESNKLADQFRRDLAENYGMDSEDAFVQAIYGIAWQQGHSGGFSSVASCFSDLVPLWELYQKKEPTTRGARRKNPASITRQTTDDE